MQKMKRHWIYANGQIACGSHLASYFARCIEGITCGRCLMNLKGAMMSRDFIKKYSINYNKKYKKCFECGGELSHEGGCRLDVKENVANAKMFKKPEKKRIFLKSVEFIKNFGGEG
jgi:hypothetical protein